MASPVTITFLGGLGEIGRNCAAFEIDGKILLLDCGLMFPDSDMLGIDVVLPDFTWLRERADDIIGCVLTHGHEDHIGALPYALAEFSFPLIGTGLTLALARPRIEEAGRVGRTEFIEMADGERRSFGPFDVQLSPVTHSVPHATATILRTPQGAIVHSGDFKLDLTPVDGRLTDLTRMGGLAATEGVRLLLSDSTNADLAGHTRSERAVGAVLFDLFHEQEGRRIITACFASHLHRIQQIADAAVAFDRVIAPLGRSMRRNITLGRERGVLDIPSDRIVDIDDIDELDPAKVCVVSTGSQGEPMSALALLAGNENRWLRVTPEDTVILSSHPIPGNEHAVTKVIDNLVRLGARVIHSGISDVHASGHARAEELKLFLSILQPEYFVPVHGEYRHLVAHAGLATLMGTPKENVLVAEDGDSVVLSDDGLARGGRVPADYVFVHGVGDVGGGVLNDRRVLADEGLVAAICCVELSQGVLVAGPEVATRGWVDDDDSAGVVSGVADAVRVALQEALDGGERRLPKLERVVRRAAGSTVSSLTRRRPMIVPVVLVA